MLPWPEETGLTPENLTLIGMTCNPQRRSLVYAWLAVVSCGKDSIRFQPGETVGYQWVDVPVFLRLVRTEPVLKIQYPRYRPYLDTLEEQNPQS